MPDRHAWINDELESLKQNSLFRHRKTRQSPPIDGMVQIDGRQFINFGSNDYLGIAADEELVLAVQNSVSQLGVGAGASALVNGRGTLHRRLEEELAKFEGTEAALLFPTGYAANVGLIGCLVAKPDVVYSDELNHASIIDGCRLSGAKTIVYRHSDLEHLASLIKNGDSFRRRLIVTDGLFSMDGDVAKLRELAELASAHDAMLVVDEAHATGVLGEHGRGTCELMQVEKQVTAKVGTLSKALGSVGGFVAATQELVDFVFNNARSQMFSTALPEMNAAASIAALKIVREDPQRRIRLHSLSQHLRHSLVEMGFQIAQSTTQIIPIILGSNDRVLVASAKLADAGVYVPAIRPPSVPASQARLRVSLSSEHTADQVEILLKILREI